MAWQDIAERLEGWGWLGAGVGAVVLAPALVPAVAKGLRPAAKGAIKGYLTVSEKAREWLAENGEQWQDLVAEAKAEHVSQANGAELMTMEAVPESGAHGGAAAAVETPADTEEGKSRARSHRKDGEAA
jgi:hypothetical protein